MRTYFHSFTRTGLNHVSGRCTLRALRAAVRVCGAPAPSLGITGDRTTRWFEVSLSFMQGGLHRCGFSVRFGSWARTNASFWYRADGSPRALKPSRFPNPVTHILNRSLTKGNDLRNLYLWERVLLGLGF